MRARDKGKGQSKTKESQRQEGDRAGMEGSEKDGLNHGGC
jgi:hypothetical protein